jgi:hypothetical protein
MQLIHQGQQFNQSLDKPANAGGVLYVGKLLLVIMLAVGMNITGFASVVDNTAAYYADNETSVGNSMRASMLDFSLTSTSTAGFVGVEEDGDIDDFSSIAQPVSGSLDMQYTVQAEFQSGSEAYCSTLGLSVNQAGTPFIYSTVGNQNTLTGLTRSTTTEFGTYEFTTIDGSYNSRQFAHGTECNVDLVFSGWRADTNNPAASGYTDQERIELRLDNRMVVMNEFLPNPDGSAHGLDYGSDHSNQPDGEWIELYNNSEKPHDLSGWHFEDEAENDVMITSANTDPATTTIPAKGWLVVYMNGEMLDNSGDTIKLKDGPRVVDEYTYDSGKYCEKEPTPNATNTESVSGDCSSVPPNKSYARIPDGVGGWVDPIPTPGAENTKEQPDDVLDSATTTNEQVAGTSTQSTDQTATTTSANSGDDSVQSTTASSTPNSTSSPDVSDDEKTASKSATTTASSSKATSTNASTNADDDKETASSTNATSSNQTASTTNEIASSTNKTSGVGTSTDADTANTATSTATSTASEDKTDGQATSTASSSAATEPGMAEGDDAGTTTDEAVGSDAAANRPTTTTKNQSATSSNTADNPDKSASISSGASSEPQDAQKTSSSSTDKKPENDGNEEKIAADKKSEDASGNEAAGQSSEAKNEDDALKADNEDKKGGGDNNAEKKEANSDNSAEKDNKNENE